MTLATDVATYELNDENNDVFGTALVDAKVLEAIRQFSRLNPRVVPETFHTVAGSRLVDISALAQSDLVWGYDSKSIHSRYGVEYPLNQEPRKYRWWRFEPDETNPSIYMELDNAPSTSSEEVKIRCYKYWTEDKLSENDGYWDVVKKMAAILCFEVTPSYYLNKFMASKAKFATITNNIDEMQDRLLQSIMDLRSGRSTVGDERAEAVAAIDLVAARITQLLADIAAARGFVNTANVNQPEVHYVRTANAEGQAANEYIKLAQSHVSTFETTGQAWRSQAAAELSNVNASLSTLRASAEHIRLWMSSINLSQAYANRANELRILIAPELNSYTIDRNQKRWSRD